MVDDGVQDPLLEPGLAELPGLLALFVTGGLLTARAATSALLGELPPEQRWLAAFVDWWSNGLFGLPLDNQRFDEHLSEWNQCPAVRDLIRDTSRNDPETPVLQRLVARADADEAVERARDALVYVRHGNQDTSSEVETFDDLVAPLRSYLAEWNYEVAPADLPPLPTARAIDRAAHARGLVVGTPRDLVMRTRLADTWETAAEALETVKAAARWRRDLGDATLDRLTAVDLVAELRPLTTDDETAGVVAWIADHLPGGTESDPIEAVEAVALQVVHEQAELWPTLSGLQRLRAYELLDPDEWLAPGTVPASIATWGARRAGIETSLAELRDTTGDDPGDGDDNLDDVAIHLLDGDLDAAEAMLEVCRSLIEARTHHRRQLSDLHARRDRAMAEFEHTDDPPSDLLRMAESVRVTEDEELRSVLAEFEAALTRVNQARRQQQVEEVSRAAEEALAELSALGPTAPVQARAQDLADAARTAATADAAQNLVQELREHVALHRDRLVEEVRAKLVELHEAGERVDGGLDEAARGDTRRVEGALGRGAVTEAMRLADAALAGFRRRSAVLWDADRDGESALVERIVRYIRARMTISDADVRRLHVALKTKPFVVLAGLSGSGKSSIARLYAEAIGATTSNGRLRREAVQPSWVDGTATIGYYNPITELFEPGWLTEVMVACANEPDRPHLVILDEMNLAPVEFYLADALSVMEDVRGGGDGTVRLYPSGVTPKNADRYDAQLRYPDNLMIIGTVNTDESTRPLSDRVLDRANVVQLELAVSDAHHLERAASDTVRPLLVLMPQWRKISSLVPDDRIHAELVELAEVLARVGIGLGLRSHVEIERYLTNATGVIRSAEAQDAALLQRVVPKLRGFKRTLLPSLERLSDIFGRLHAVRCQFVVQRWLDVEVDLDVYLDGADQSIGLLLSTAEVVYPETDETVGVVADYDSTLLALLRSHVYENATAQVKLPDLGQEMRRRFPEERLPQGGLLKRSWPWATPR